MVLELAFNTRYSELYSDFCIPTSIVGSDQEILHPWDIYAHPVYMGDLLDVVLVEPYRRCDCATIRKIRFMTGLAATSPLSFHAMYLHTPYWLAYLQV